MPKLAGVAGKYRVNGRRRGMDTKPDAPVNKP